MLAAVATAGVILPRALDVVETAERAAVMERLAGEARAAGGSLSWTEGAALDAECTRLASLLGVRLTVVAPDGRVLGESSRLSSGLERHDDRPEIAAALAQGVGSSVRASGTLGVPLVYVAVRQEESGRQRVVRVAVSPARLHDARRQVFWGLLAGLALVAGAGTAAAVVNARTVRRRIARLVEFTKRTAAGQVGPYVGPERTDDVGALEAGVAAMARAAESTISGLRVEQERLEAILRGMVEGVVVTDLDRNVVLINARARDLLEAREGGDISGQPLAGLSRDPGLAEVAHELAAGAETVSRDVVLGGLLRRTLQVNAARLRGAGGAAFGYVLVLHDVTELRRLEVVRRDFVANVSHELRTPLTAIKGYAETLLGDAGDDRETARRFLKVIDRHSERLGRLIDDLLALSDLELGRTELRRQAIDVGDVVEDVLDILGHRIRSGEVAVTSAVQRGRLRVDADGDRLRQVLINLVDNALKFTPAGGRIEIGAVAIPAEGGATPMVAITVADTGIGIPARDLPRLTERFFRVDKARSRDLGGTGLGLAIVNQIVQLHGGTVGITSTQGHGTTVRVLLPAAQSVRGT